MIQLLATKEDLIPGYFSDVNVMLDALAESRVWIDTYFSSLDIARKSYPTLVFREIELTDAGCKE